MQRTTSCLLALGLSLAFTTWAHQSKEYRTEKVEKGHHGRPRIYFKQGCAYQLLAQFFALQLLAKTIMKEMSPEPASVE
eukprot:1145261-Pelagomonas_calceolata.AAC.1